MKREKLAIIEGRPTLWGGLALFAAGKLAGVFVGEHEAGSFAMAKNRRETIDLGAVSAQA
ncbi:MAG: hypothetical protein ACLP0J_24760 [Solirubrobacteraceae bacterium]